MMQELHSEGAIFMQLAHTAAIYVCINLLALLTLVSLHLFPGLSPVSVQKSIVRREHTGILFLR